MTERAIRRNRWGSDSLESTAVKLLILGLILLFVLSIVTGFIHRFFP